LGGIIGVILIVVILWDGFETIVLPRRVMRRLRLTRLFYRYTWLPWSWLAHAVSSGGRLDSILGFYGPLSLLLLICVWASVLVFGFGLLHFALGSGLSTLDHMRGFATDLYMSGTTFFTLGLGDVRPVFPSAKVITVIEAGMGFGFLALVIAYLPALNQSFSRREASISMLDARAGSPPSAVAMFQRHNHEGGMDELRSQLSLWEQWSAELLESHLSYPVLAYYRSQHDNQSWLAALTAVLDTAALAVAVLGGGCSRQAELTFAMARHAAVDMAAVFDQPPVKPDRDRLDSEGFSRLRSMLEAAGFEVAGDGEGPETRLRRLREFYEPYVYAMADHFCLSVPPWIPEATHAADWETSRWDRGTPLLADHLHDAWKNHHFR